MGESAIDWSGASRRAQHAHELLETREAGVAELPLRSDVRESWKRSLASLTAVQVPSVLSDDHLRLARERSELQRIWPVFENSWFPQQLTPTS